MVAGEEFSSIYMSKAQLRVLVLTPYLPWPATGACQQDRVAGFEILKSLGYDVEVIAKMDDHHISCVAELQLKTGIPITGVPYRRSQELSICNRFLWLLRRLSSIFYLDGAAYEYTDPAYRDAVYSTMQRFRPEVVWVDYTYLWPVYSIIRAFGARIVTRSANFEPRHYLEESGHGLLQYLLYVPKWLGERRAACLSDWMCAITPAERGLYQAIGAKRISVLPLRALPNILTKEIHTDPPRDGLGRIHLFFSGSTYNVRHNRVALLFLLEEVVPVLRRRIPGKYILHVLGGKVPKEILDTHVAQDVIFEGFIDDLEVFLQGMHVAVIPSLVGAGMQQKVFEPLARGFPVVTHERAMAGYAFQAGIEVLYGDNAQEFTSQIIRLLDPSVRRSIGQAARLRSQQLFSRDRLNSIIQQAINSSLNV